MSFWVSVNKMRCPGVVLDYEIGTTSLVEAGREIGSLLSKVWREIRILVGKKRRKITEFFIFYFIFF